MAWHPRDNAHPVVWELRNGQHGDAYARVRAVHVAGRMKSIIEYELLEPNGVVGRYPTGDDAAIVGWVRFLERSGRAGGQSTVTTVDEARVRLAHQRRNEPRPATMR